MKMLCPHCGVKGTVDDLYIGKKVRCPKCEATFEIVADEIPSAAFSPEPEVQEIPESLTSSVEQEDVDDSVAADSEESQEESLEWSDIAIELDQESLDLGETDTSEEKIFPASSGELVAETDEPAMEERYEEQNEIEVPSVSPRFSVSGVLKAAWQETKGAKSSIWTGTIIMYLVLVSMSAAGAFLMPYFGFELSPMAVMGIGVALQVLASIISVIFTAGLLYMGVRKVAGETISWKMIFKGFSFSGRIILTTLLQTILVGIGLFLLVLPGIYLMIGYGLTLPLILDRKMSAWEAMEASRKAIHKVWWKVTGALILMGIIYLISAIPLGIGIAYLIAAIPQGMNAIWTTPGFIYFVSAVLLGIVLTIWTVPMFILLGGVIYRYLFGVEETG